jgi:predicted dehydrogenase
VDEIMNDPTIEAVAVETDEIYCTKYALMAAKAGKHVHMEKPGGRELADFEELIATIKEKNLIFCPGYMYRYNPYVQELMAAIKNGDLGEILSVEAQMNCTHSTEQRQWFTELPGGMMFYLGCHLIDLIYRIQGTPNKIHALSRPTFVEGAEGKDYGMAVLEYDRGVSFAKCISLERGGYRRRQLAVTGTKATWEIKPLELGPEAGMTTSRTVYTEVRPWGHPGVSSTSEVFDRYNTMLTHFARCVRGEIENEFTPDYELELYKLLLQCCGE